MIIIRLCGEFPEPILADFEEKLPRVCLDTRFEELGVISIEFSPSSVSSFQRDNGTRYPNPYVFLIHKKADDWTRSQLSGLRELGELLAETWGLPVFRQTYEEVFMPTSRSGDGSMTQ